MGCGSSTVASTAGQPGAHAILPSSPGSSTTPGHHPNTSLVLGSDGTASARARRLRERPKTGTQAIEGEALKSIKEQKKKKREEQALNLADSGLQIDAAQLQTTSSGSDSNPLSPAHSPTSPDHAAGASAGDFLDGVAAPAEKDAAATDDGDSSSSSEDEEEDRSSEDDDDDDDSMEEIEEEPGEQPLDDGAGIMSPVMNGRPPTTLAPSARPHNMLHRGNSLHKLLKTFAPENVHILVVDDDATHMEVVAQWLALKRYHVTLCNDGEEAVEVLSASFANRTPRAPADESEESTLSVLAPSTTATTTETSQSQQQQQPAEDFDLILSDLCMETPEGQPLPRLGASSRADEAHSFRPDVQRFLRSDL